MAIVIKKGKKLYVQWYDPVKKQTFSKSTGLNSNYENMKLAKQHAKDIQESISNEYKKIKGNRLRESTIQDAFNHFLNLNKGKKEKTIRDYNRFFEFFKRSFQSEEGVSVVNKISYESWLMNIKGLDLQPNSIHAIGKQGNHFVNFLFEYDYIDVFRVNRNVKTKPEVKEKIIFTEKELVKIYNNLPTKNENFTKLINILYYTGLRSKDILTIKRENIDTKLKIMTYYDNKRKIWRSVPYHNKLQKIFVEELKNAADGQILDYSSEDNITKAVKRYFVEGLKWENTPLSPRTFRKTFMSRLRMRGVDTTLVQELVGHAHTSVIDIHYNAIDKKVLATSLNKYPSFEQLKKWSTQKKKTGKTKK